MSARRGDSSLSDLLEVLSLRQVAQDEFVGRSDNIGTRRLFGGLLVAQGLCAAHATAGNRLVHSHHAYFIKRGNPEGEIHYRVERCLDSRVSAHRRVLAMQDGQLLFHISASFASPQSGLVHQSDSMPAVPNPEELQPSTDIHGADERSTPQSMWRFLRRDRPFEFREVTPVNGASGRVQSPHWISWVRTVGKLADSEQVHRMCLAYLSDFVLLPTAALPHGISYLSDELRMMSLDHAMWYHARVRVDEWLLLVCESRRAINGRCLTEMRAFDRAGSVVVTAAQEGIFQQRTTFPMLDHSTTDATDAAEC